MKWFKHHSDSHNNLKVQAVISGHGMAAYGTYWVCVELIANQGMNYTIAGDKGWKEALIYRTRESAEQVEKYIHLFAETNLIDAEALARGDLYIPKLADYGDEYSSRKKDVPIDSRQDRDSVVLEENRLDKNRLEEKRGKYPRAWLKEISDQDLKELVVKFDGSASAIRRKGEQLYNYCLAKDKKYSNHRAMLENALDKDFGRRVVTRPVEVDTTTLTPEQKERQKKYIAQMKAIAEGKKIQPA